MNSLNKHEYVQCALGLLYYISEEGEAKVVIGHVSCVEHQSAVSAALLSSCQCDLAVLHYLINPIHFADHTHRLCGIGFLHHLKMMKTFIRKLLTKDCSY